MTSTLIATPDNAVRQQAMVFDRSWAIASDRAPVGALGLTTTNVITSPMYAKDQRVCFVGGGGKILYCRPESGTWTYAVQMEMGPEPDMGRIGSETTILLDEADIQGVMN